MARSITSGLRTAMQAQETGEVILAICEIDHPAILNGPLRVVNDLADFVRDGNTYTARPFAVTLPSDTESGIGSVRLTLDSVDRTEVREIRRIPPGSRPTIQIDLAMKSKPDEIQVSFPNLTMQTVSYDAFTIEGDLALDEDDREPFPRSTFAPQTFPGVA